MSESETPSESVDPAPAPPAGPPKPLTRGKKWTIRGLVVVASILCLLSVLAIWIDKVALDNDVYTTTSAKLLQDPKVQSALANYLVDQLYTNVDVETQIENALPERLKPLAGPAATALRPYAVQGAERLLASPIAQGLWRVANQKAHDRFVLLVTSGDNGRLSSTNGNVVLDLQPILEKLAGGLGNGTLATAIPADAGQIVIIRSEKLDTVQAITHALQQVANYLWILTLAIYVLAVYLARGDRRWAVRLIGFGLIAVGIVLIVGRHVTGNYLVHALADYPNAQAASGDVWNILTERLASANVTIVVVGILVVLWAWLSGAGRRAVGLRRRFAPEGRDHQERIWLVYAAFVALILLWGPTISTRQWLPALLLTVLGVLGIEALRRQSVKEFPEAAAVDWKPTLKLPSRGGDDISKLERLKALHDSGALTDEEFAAQKAELLGRDT
jgi:hypothetical protein